MNGPLRIAVVGHTNTGKTSLLRTLARDPEFGEVSDEPATTRSISTIDLLVHGEPVVRLADTPGMEDSISLLARLDELKGSARLDGPAQLQLAFDDDLCRRRFPQELASLREVMGSDLAFVVIDARDRVLPRHRDELDLFSRCGRPLIPLLNFTAAAQAQTSSWKDALSRLGLHATAEFDTVAFSEADEIRLFEKALALSEAHRAPLQRLIEDRRRRGEHLRRTAARCIADLLLDASEMVEAVDRVDDRGVLDRASERLRDRLRQREQEGVQTLLAAFDFRPGDALGDDIPLIDGQWGVDLFSPAAIRRAAPSVGASAAAGAATGAGIDLVVGGISLGAAAAIGAAIGSVLGFMAPQRRRLLHRAKGGSELRPGPATLRLLAARQLELARALLRRGHAAQSPVKIEANNSDKAGVDGIEPLVELLQRNGEEATGVDGSRSASAFSEMDPARVRRRESLMGRLDGLLQGRGA